MSRTASSERTLFADSLASLAAVPSPLAPPLVQTPDALPSSSPCFHRLLSSPPTTPTRLCTYSSFGLLALPFAPAPASRNTSLLSPFLLDYPSSLSHTLDDSASCISFNPHGYFSGSFLAVGRTDGCISIWDVLTHDVVWVETGHSRSVESVCWSRNSRFLLSASRDGTVILWDLERSERVETIRFEGPVIDAQFHPANSKVLVATLGTGQVFVVDLRPSSRGRREVFDLQLPNNGMDVDEGSLAEGSGKGKQRATEEGGSERKRTLLTAARFNPSGRRLYVGTKSGDVLILDSLSHDVRPFPLPLTLLPSFNLLTLSFFPPCA